MTTKAHSLLTGADLHEPKGIAGVPANQVYISDGAGSGTWQNTASTIGVSQFSTGDLKPTWKTAADNAWIMCDDGTIGSAASAATNRANADTSALYALIWNNFANTEAPVSGSRGASAAADFAANKTIKLPLVLGRVFGVAGAGAGLTSRVLGKTLGEETHLQTTGEMPVHNHAITDPTHSHTIPGSAVTFSGATFNVNGGGQSLSTTASVNASATGITINNAGSGTAFNVMQPTTFLNMMVKL